MKTCSITEVKLSKLETTVAAGLIGKVLRVFELLAPEPGGIGLQALADRMQMPMGSMHRMLGELAQHGYVLQVPETQKYRLTAKLFSLASQGLTATGIVDLAQPILDRLAASSKELVRLALVDGPHLTWIARAQGAGPGLRYDPDMGQEAALFCTSAGHAWLAHLDENEALRIVTSQGFGLPNVEYGPNAPRSFSALAKCLRETRERGYAAVIDSAAVGTSAMAAPVMLGQAQRVVGTVSIAGPSARLTVSRMTELGPALRRAASDLSSALRYVDYFQSADTPRAIASVQ